MGLFTRKSKWDLMLEAVTAAAVSTAADRRIRRAAKVGLGVAAGAVSATAASAAVSSARQQANK
ncbi:hypothetical protein ACPPVT_06505 [Angustibacter sp. McL0619]|uniref:hypothetical protein n=1 Tax=Angustibacter sp. McL0619 TaxID=3415676 RepID=UPI003CEBE6B4